LREVGATLFWQFALSIISPPMPKSYDLHVNGENRHIDVDGERTLLSVLRNELDLTGTKYGCGEGQCGACTVLVDGLPTRSCLTSVAEVGSRPISTIESLDRDGQLHPLQQAFLDTDALQCGYCTSGMILSGVALLRNKPAPSEEDILHAMNGNLCRCGTYRRIIAAIQRAAAKVRSDKS
jgi:aerobic-type carbon monoxide dehydrogenase small subunit (CoxS/CutS family)